MSDLISYGFLTPPAVLILLSLVGALLALRWRRFGLALVILSSMALYAFATPFVASWLLHDIESRIPDNVDLSSAQAIVVLGGGVHIGDAATIPDMLSPLSLERVVYAAEAYRRLHLPVAVSGGRIFPARTAEAALMRAALERDFAVPVTWSDDQSRTTYENALYTARLLSSDHITSAIIVTHAWHLPRALWAFERVGLHALRWSVPLDFVHLQRIDDLLPNIAALQESSYALHEMIGLGYYRLRY